MVLIKTSAARTLQALVRTAAASTVVVLFRRATHAHGCVCALPLSRGDSASPTAVPTISEIMIDHKLTRAFGPHQRPIQLCLDLQVFIQPTSDRSKASRQAHQAVSLRALAVNLVSLAAC